MLVEYFFCSHCCYLHCTHLIIVDFFRPFSILWPCHFFSFVFGVCSFWRCIQHSNFVSHFVSFLVWSGLVWISVLLLLVFFSSLFISTEPSFGLPLLSLSHYKTGPRIQCKQMLDIDWLTVHTVRSFVCVSFSSLYLFIRIKLYILYNVFTHQSQTSDFEKAVYIFPLFHIYTECVAIADNGLCILAVRCLCVRSFACAHECERSYFFICTNKRPICGKIKL